MPTYSQEINRFLNTWKRPAILAMSRPDAKKNITTLVQAFGENPELRKWANLVLVMVRPVLAVQFCAVSGLTVARRAPSAGGSVWSVTGSYR